MTRYLIRRLLQLVPVVLIASLAIWAMIYAVPGGPIGALLGENATPQEIQFVTHKLGLDRPILVQFGNWLSNAAHGDLGVSITSSVPVRHLIAQRLPATIQLGIAATIVGLLLGVPVAFLGALMPGSWVDRALSGWSALALGVPTFWLGILLILLFSVQLHWLPAASGYVPFFEAPWPAVRNLLLPASTLGIYVSGIFARFLRASLVSELKADYVRTARSKGLRERDVIMRHVMRNAMLPFVTIVGLMMATFIGGTVVTEVVFTYPGIGTLLVSAISQRDYPLIQGCILVILVLYMIIGLLIDLLYAYIDPRIEHG